MMAAPVILCPKCQQPLPTGEEAIAAPHACPACGAKLHVYAFPALFNPAPVGSAGERVLQAEEAGCFYHPHKKASVLCDSCGRFLCALCDIAFNAQHLCPTCLETGQKQGTLQHLEHQRALYDNIVLSLAILPMFIFFWLTIVTAPVSIVLALWYWNRPSSLLPRTKVRFVIAISLALLQIGGWTIFFVPSLRELWL